MIDAAPAVPLPYGPAITLQQAHKVANAAMTEASNRGWPMIIAIVDSAGHLVLFNRMDQAQLGSIEAAQRKAATAVAFRRPTLDFERRVTAGGIDLRLLGMHNVLPVEGGVPLVLGGVLIGGIGVSGMASDQDGQIARAGAAALEPA